MKEQKARPYIKTDKEKTFIVETAVWPISFLFNMFTAFKRSQFKFNLLLLQLVLNCVAALKILPVHHP